MADQELEFKATPAFTYKDDGSDPTADPRVVKQIFSVMGTPDDLPFIPDIIRNGAFKKTLKERPDRIRVLWQHDASQPPIGVPLTLKEISKNQLPDELAQKYPDATGALYGEVKYLETPRGEEVLQGIKAGAIRENSIGFDPVKWSLEGLGEDGSKKKDDQRIRYLDEIRLWDISPVNWGAHPATQNIKGALPFKATPKCDEGMAWDAGAEMKKCQSAADYRAVCAWVDSEGDPEARGSYKLPHHQGDGEHGVVWKGVAAAMGALLGARGGTKLPDGDRKAVYNHLAKHYAQFEKTPPDFKWIELSDSVQLVRSLSNEQLAALLTELREGREIDPANMTRLQAALQTVDELLFTAEPPAGEPESQVSVEPSSALTAGLQAMALTTAMRIKTAERELGLARAKA